MGTLGKSLEGMKRSHREQIEWIEKKHLAEPGWWSGVQMRIAEGEDMNAIKDELALMWGPLRWWIGNDSVREAEYQRALSHRAEFAKQTAAQGVQIMAAKRFDASAIEPQHALRASELILGTHSTLEHIFESDRQSEEQILQTLRGLVEANPRLLDVLNEMRPDVAKGLTKNLTYTQGNPADISDAVPSTPEGDSDREAETV